MTGLKYIIIQAGGKGTRLKQYTVNKPKAIVSVDNLPTIFHLFKKYPDARFIIIGDYLKNVLDRYLDTFCEVRYITVGTDSFTGTCSGISNALKHVPEGERFMLIWSDLVLGKDFVLPESDSDFVGISGSFECRWSYIDGRFVEESSEKNGVAGMFVFSNKSNLNDVPVEGEFVRWLQSKNKSFERLELTGAAEYGLIESLKKPEYGRCRPFNNIRKEKNFIIKEGITEQGKKLATKEKNWYRHVRNYDVAVPEIYSYNPLTMEYVDGENAFCYTLGITERKEILESIMDSLKSLHFHDRSPADSFSLYEAYFRKTVNRLSKVRDLIPFANERILEINGRKCRNVFFYLDELRERIKSIPCEFFCLIHGDCTFSNIILRHGKEPVFIDPRGYFGFSEIVGDPTYDWAKLYYSVIGDYDQFNLGKFRLEIRDRNVILNIETNGWNDLEDEFIKNLPKNVSIDDVRLLHSIIWLSLTTYAWDDYDSICGAFYNGLYYLEELL